MEQICLCFLNMSIDLFIYWFQLYITGGLYRIMVLIVYSICLIYTRLLLMGYAPPSFSPAENPAANNPDILTRFLTFAYLPFCNLWLLIYPFQLSYDWSMNTIPLVESIAQFENLLSAILYFSLLFVIYHYIKFCWRQRPQIMDRKEDVSRKECNETKFLFASLNIMIFAIGCMVLPFLPATNIFFYVGFIVAERILYIPSIGFCLLIINGLHLLLKFKRQNEKKILTIMVFILVMFSVKTYLRNFDWINEETLYRWDMDFIITITTIIDW